LFLCTLLCLFKQQEEEKEKEKGAKKGFSLDGREVLLTFFTLSGKLMSALFSGNPDVTLLPSDHIFKLLSYLLFLLHLTFQKVSNKFCWALLYFLSLSLSFFLN